MLPCAGNAVPTDSGESMFLSARPHTKLAAAVLTAGMVATAPAIVGAGPESMRSLSNAGVQPASFVTDVLNNAGSVVSAAASAVLIGTDLVLGLNYYWDDADFGWGVPFNPVFWAAAFSDNQRSALSYLLQTYLNPSDNYVDPSDTTIPYYAYPWYLKNDVVLQLVNVLPAPLAVPITQAINNVANGINHAFANLADPTPAITAMWQLYNTPIGRLIYAAQDVIALPVTLAAAVTYYLAYLPADLEATFESAIQHPADIPGLLSHLVYGALDPDLYQGLLGNLTYNLVKPLFFLPPPTGDSGFGTHDGLAYSLYSHFVDTVNHLLSYLPAPITPTPLPSAAVSESAVAVRKGVAAQTDSTSPVTEGQSAERKGGAQGQSARTPRGVKQERAAKSGGTKKAEGERVGGHGRSARPSKADTAA